ncbi:MAG: hypothetical protein HOM16_10485 [Woeseia sp.]|nr:hypothetical protein [Woeseia sp.]
MVLPEFGERIKFKFAEIIDESADQTLDRLRNGDVVRDAKTGELVRVPIKGRDVAIVGAVAFDKHRLILNRPTTICGTSPALQTLAKQFQQISDSWEEKKVTSIPGEYEKIT